jgi:hypothetical protein
MRVQFVVLDSHAFVDFDHAVEKDLWLADVEVEEARARTVAELAEVFQTSGGQQGELLSLVLQERICSDSRPDTTRLYPQSILYSIISPKGEVFTNRRSLQLLSDRNVPTLHILQHSANGFCRCIAIILRVNREQFEDEVISPGNFGDDIAERSSAVCLMIVNFGVESGSCECRLTYRWRYGCHASHEPRL